MVERASPFSLRVSEESLQAYREAAEDAGLSVSEWARLVLDMASGASPLIEQVARTRFTYTVDLGGLTPDQQYGLLSEVRAAQKAGTPMTKTEIETRLKTLKGRKVREGKW